MTEQKSGAQISVKAFVQAVLIIFALMMVSGILTRVIPAGSYDRAVVDGREVIDAASFQFTARPDFPIWRWFTAPVEVLFTPDGLTKVIPIIVFILLVGTAFGVMDKSGILQAVISRIVKTFGGHKYILLLIVTFFFMALGTFFGIFEEVIPLVPLMIGLAYFLGWDLAHRFGHVGSGDQRWFFNRGLQSLHHWHRSPAFRPAVIFWSRTACDFVCGCLHHSGRFHYPVCPQD